MATISKNITGDLTTIYGNYITNNLQAFGAYLRAPTPSNAIDARKSGLTFVGSRTGAAATGVLAVDGVGDSTAVPVAMGRITVSKLDAAANDTGYLTLEINAEVGSAGSLLQTAKFLPTGMTLAAVSTASEYAIKSSGSQDLVLGTAGGTPIRVTAAGTLVLTGSTGAFENIVLNTTGGNGTSAFIDVDSTGPATDLHLKIEGNTLFTLNSTSAATLAKSLTFSEATPAITVGTSLEIKTSGASGMTITPGVGTVLGASAGSINAAAAESIAFGNVTTGTALTVTPGSQLLLSTATNTVRTALDEPLNISNVTNTGHGLKVQPAATSVVLSPITASDSVVISNSGGSMTLAGSGAVTFSAGVLVNGNLTVSGTTTTINSTVIEHSDPLLTLGVAQVQTTTPDSGHKIRRTGAGIAASALAGSYAGALGLSNNTVSAVGGASAAVRTLALSTPISGVTLASLVGWTVVQLNGSSVTIGLGIIGTVTDASNIIVDASTATSPDGVDGFTAAVGLYIIPGTYKSALFSHSANTFQLAYSSRTVDANILSSKGFSNLEIGSTLKMSGSNANTIKWNQGIASGDRSNFSIHDGTDTARFTILNGESTVRVDKVESLAASGAVTNFNGALVTSSGTNLQTNTTKTAHEFQLSGTSKVQVKTDALHLETGVQLTTTDASLLVKTNSINVVKVNSDTAVDKGLSVYHPFVFRDSNGDPCFQMIVNGTGETATLEIRRIHSAVFTGTESLRQVIS